MAHLFLHHVQTNTSINFGVYRHIKLDASHNPMLIAQMLAGAAPPPQKRVYRDVNAHIATLVQGHNNGNIIPFLSGISYNLAAQ